MCCHERVDTCTVTMDDCAVCLMEPHMNISKPSVNKSNTGVRTLISHYKRRTLVTLKYCFSLSRKMREISTVWSDSVRLIENAWVSREMRETWQVWTQYRSTANRLLINQPILEVWGNVTLTVKKYNRKMHRNMETLIFRCTNSTALLSL